MKESVALPRKRRTSAAHGADDAASASRPKRRTPTAERPGDRHRGSLPQSVFWDPDLSATSARDFSAVAASSANLAAAASGLGQTSPTFFPTISSAPALQPSLVASGMPLPLPCNVDWGDVLTRLLSRSLLASTGAPTAEYAPQASLVSPLATGPASTASSDVQAPTGPGAIPIVAGRPFLDFSPASANSCTGLPFVASRTSASACPPPALPVPSQPEVAFTLTDDDASEASGSSDLDPDDSFPAVDPSSLRSRPIAFLAERYPQFFVAAPPPPQPLDEVDTLLGVAPVSTPALLKEPSALSAALSRVFDPTFQTNNIKISPLLRFFPLGSGLLPAGTLPRVSEDPSLRHAPVPLTDSGFFALSASEARAGELSSHTALASACTASALLPILTQLLGSHTPDSSGVPQFQLHEVSDSQAIAACLHGLSKTLEQSISASASLYRRFIVARRSIALSQSRLPPSVRADLIASPFTKTSLFGPSLTSSCQRQADRNRDLLISSALTGTRGGRKRSAAPRPAFPQSAKRRSRFGPAQSSFSAPQPSFPPRPQFAEQGAPPRSFRGRAPGDGSRAGPSRPPRGARQRLRRGSYF